MQRPDKLEALNFKVRRVCRKFQILNTGKNAIWKERVKYPKCDVLRLLFAQNEWISLPEMWIHATNPRKNEENNRFLRTRFFCSRESRRMYRTAVPFGGCTHVADKRVEELARDGQIKRSKLLPVFIVFWRKKRGRRAEGGRGCGGGAARRLRMRRGSVPRSQVCTNAARSSRGSLLQFLPSPVSGDRMRGPYPNLCEHLCAGAGPWADARALARSRIWKLHSWHPGCLHDFPPVA